jgi:predicted P-loop ATPase
VNEVSFLKDKTGSTRFLVLPIKKADGFHRIDMMQLYRQIIETKGYIDFELNEDEQKKQKLINEEFQQPDVIEEQFTSFFEIDFKEGGNYQNCTQILEQLGHSKRDINYAKRCDIANTLRKYKFDYQKKTKRWKVKLKEATKKVNKEENEDEF